MSIRGSSQEAALVLCTRDKSLTLSEWHTSNTLLLSSLLGETWEFKQYWHPSPASEQVRPRLEQWWQTQSKKELLEGVEWCGNRPEIAASDGEIEQAMVQLFMLPFSSSSSSSSSTNSTNQEAGIIRIRPELVERILGMVISSLVAKYGNWTMAPRVDDEEDWDGYAEYVAPITNWFLSTSQNMGKTNLIRFLIERVFSGRPNRMSREEFRQRWDSLFLADFIGPDGPDIALECPDKEEGILAYGRGLVVFDEAGQVCYLPWHQFVTASEAMAGLFRIKPTWKEHDLYDYMKSFSNDRTEIGRWLIRWCAIGSTESGTHEPTYEYRWSL